MKDSEILGYLEQLTQNLSIDLRYEKGEFSGGLCRVNDKQMMIINKRLSDDQKIKVFARAIGQLNLENIYILPAIREIIEEQLKEKRRTTSAGP
ncbi:hypothetical protein JW964_17410 [candidate division KSB1 bacterium]|nr:hypothetical protein [candidate division KSB1 bacterium]